LGIAFREGGVTEAQLQRSIVDFLKVVLPPEYRAVAVPNASIRTAGGRAGNAVAGLSRGFADVIVVGQGRLYAMEIKTEKGRLSEFQKEWQFWATNTGATPWVVVRSVDDVRTCLTVWNIPTRNHRIM
jgi:hypothetical protein